MQIVDLCRGRQMCPTVEVTRGCHQQYAKNCVAPYVHTNVNILSPNMTQKKQPTYITTNKDVVVSGVNADCLANTN